MGKGASGQAVEAKPMNEQAFDILKGIGISEVLLHHSLSFSARKFSEEHSFQWWTMMLTNRVFHFAIPTFLLVSALLLARSLSKNERIDFKRYGKRRVFRTLYPYLLWTAIAILVRLFVIRSPSDLAEHSLSLPFGIELVGPSVLLDPERLKAFLLFGKAFYHLYFLSILTQLSIVLPLCVVVFQAFGKNHSLKLAYAGVTFREIPFRLPELRLGAVLFVAVLMQIGVYLMQVYVWRSPNPASYVLWYTPAVFAGAWLGLNTHRWSLVWRAWRAPAIGLAVGAGLAYLLLSTLVYRGIRFPNFYLNMSFMLYATSTAFALLGLAHSVRRSALTQVLATVGQLSLPLFIIHPFLLAKMGGPTISSIFAATGVAPLAVYLFLYAATLGVTYLLIGLRLDLVLFARNFREEWSIAARRNARAAQHRT